MGKKKIDVYRTGIYLRLSQGDEDIDGWEKQESNSISNQRLLLEGYIDAHDDLKLVDVFIDDGYTGSNFDRPEFQRMMKSMKAGNLDCIMVKDLSRLGRERIGVDELILRTFKEYGVRFISVSDNYDSLTANRGKTHTIIPFKNLMNEQYNNDTSLKVRTSQQVKRMNGQFIGALAPYGYKKAENNKNLLVPDLYAAGVVQGIFAKKLAGVSAMGIAKILNKNGVLSPSEYRTKCGEKYNTSFKSAGQSKWSAKTVIRILKNVVYTGTLAQGKHTTVSHKVKKEIEVPEEDWIVVENAHEPIISKMDFDAVQILMSRDTKAIAGQSEAYMYAGILYCGDCGNSMVRRKDSYKGQEYVNYICSNYNRNGKENCSRHCIREDVLDVKLEEQKLKAEEILPVYSPRLGEFLECAIRIWNEYDIDGLLKKQCAEVYTRTDIITFEREAIGSLFRMVDARTHHFTDIPVIVIWNNEEVMGDYEPVLPSVDAYDKAMSDTANDSEYFADAYLCIVGAGGGLEDGTTATRMKKSLTGQLTHLERTDCCY